MLFRRQYLVYFLIYKNLQLKYKHSALGFLWSILHPLFYLLIFIAVFSHAFPQIPHYTLFVLSGLIFWIYFSGSCSQLSQVFIKHTHLLKSQNIPVSIYPVAEQSSEFVSFFIGLLPFTILMFFCGLHFTANLFYVIPVIILFTMFTFSVGLILGSLNVFFRDVSILWNTLNPALFYLSPIAFSYEIIPEKYRFIVHYNPLYYFLNLIRDVLYIGRAPVGRTVLECCLITLVSSGIAYLIFRKVKNGFVSNL